MKTHVKKGDVVVAISGSQKGKQGKILQVLPTRGRAIVEGLALHKRHQKKTQKLEGGIIEREGSIHLSNLMLVSEFDRRKAARKEAASS